MLEVKNISVRYKKKIVLKDVSFSADFGQCIGLLGINGSGKSTLLSTISGALKPESGELFLNKISASENRKDYRKEIGYVTQENPLIPELTALDNLRLWTSLSGKELGRYLSEPPLSMLNVASFLKTPVSKLSGGMKKRLSIASVLLGNPKVLLLDEPFAALDLIAKHDILDYIQYYVRSGGIAVIASHEETIFDYCHKVYLLNQGSLTDTSLLPENTSYIELLRSTLCEEA